MPKHTIEIVVKDARGGGCCGCLLPLLMGGVALTVVALRKVGA